jgi:hypothetical protein
VQAVTRAGDSGGSILGEGPDPEFEKPFTVYANYLEDLAGLIAGHLGWSDSLVEGVYSAVMLNPGVRKIQRRGLGARDAALLERCLRKAWGNLRRVCREIEDEFIFDEEANAWIPAQSYYSVYHAALGVAVASGQDTPRDHTASLRQIADQVSRGRLPFPWNVFAKRCPQLGECQFHGLRKSGVVHPLSAQIPKQLKRDLPCSCARVERRSLTGFRA